MNSEAADRKYTNGRVEVQLRAQLADLEARAADLSRCLEDAEQRAGELLTMRARAALLEQRMAVILSSRSWRFTAPLRRIVKHVRGASR